MPGMPETTEVQNSPRNPEAPAVGVYLCRCEGNISEVVDLAAVKAFAKTLAPVKLVRVHESMCSAGAQAQVVADIQAKGLDRVVIACCSPHFHEEVFQQNLRDAGLNPYMLDIANIREQGSWVHYEDPAAATEKAKALVAASLEQVVRNELLSPSTMPLGDRVVVIGAGIAGIQAALDLAEGGVHVTLVEKEPTIGGRMGQLSRTFPTNDCAPCILDPKLADVATHPDVDLRVYTEVVAVEGSIGNFTITLEEKPRYVDAARCKACGRCAEACPVSVPHEYNFGLNQRSAIYIPRSEAVPRAYVIDADACLKCPKPLCVQACPMDDCISPPSRDAEPDRVLSMVEADCIVVATGFDLYDLARIGEYHFDASPDIIHGGQMERMIIGTGPTGGNIVRPSTSTVPTSIAFVLCAGSRDKDHCRYCSEICCMYSMKQAYLAKKKLGPETHVSIYYTDIRAAGKGFEEYYDDVRAQGVEFIRGRPAELQPTADGKVRVWAMDTLLDAVLQEEYDLVVLAPAIVPNTAAGPLAEMLKLPRGANGFFKELHPKYRPIDTRVSGVFLAGAALGPNDIRGSVTQGSAAAARVGRLINKGHIEVDPITARVDPTLAKQAGVEMNQWVDACPSHAIKVGAGLPRVQEELCTGCGLCTNFGPPGTFTLRNNSSEQLLAQVRAAVATRDAPPVIAFLDDTCSYEAADTLSSRRTLYSSRIHPVRVPDACIVTTSIILRALHVGAAAVFVGACEETVNPFSPECTRQALQNAAEVKKRLEPLGLADRVGAADIVTGGPSKLLAQFQAIAAVAEEQGPLSTEQRARVIELDAA